MFCPARTNVTDNVLLGERPAAVKVKITVRAENIVVKPSERRTRRGVSRTLLLASSFRCLSNLELEERLN